MAVTPKEALGNKLAQEQQRVTELEKKCDKQLESQWKGEGQVWVDAGGFSHDVIETVLRRFQRAGWWVRRNTSPRQDEALVFSVLGSGSKGVRNG